MKYVKYVILGVLAVIAMMVMGNLYIFSIGGISTPGSSIPHFTLKDYHENSWCTHELAGKVTVLTFWFPTCPSCLRELPRLEQLYKEYKEQGLNVVAIEATGQRAAAERVIGSNGLSFTFLQNGSGAEEVVSGLFNIELFPTTLILDKQGVVRFKHVGFHPGTEKLVESQVKGLLNE